MATLVAAMAFGLLLTGALVTFRNGVAVPPWPTFAPLHQPPAGSVEHQGIFSIVAGLTGALSLILTVWAWATRREDRVKVLAGFMTLSVFALPLLSLTRFPSSLPAMQPILYSCVAQGFFSLTICLALFTRTNWNWDQSRTPETSRPSLRQLAVFTTVAAFCESLLGVVIRSRSVGTHLVLGIALTMCTLWMLEIAFDRYPEVPGLKAPAVVLAEVVVLEVFIGIFAHSMKLDAPSGPQQAPGLAVVSTTHAAVGALALGASLFLTFQSFKYLAPREAVSRQRSAISLQPSAVSKENAKHDSLAEG